MIFTAIRAWRVYWVVPAAFALGCGSTETGGETMTCGAGTHPEGNTCVPDEVDGGAGGSGVGGGGSGGQADSGGSGGTGGDADSGPVDPSGDCPAGLPGPKLIEVSTPAGTKYCVDATEVTGAHYNDFLEAKHEVMTGQPPECEGNTSYGDGWVQTYPTDTEPAFNVDWCDAYMYCQWAGKHLCGAVGGGAIVSAGDMNDPEKSEWYNACSSGGEYRYPYGDVYDPQACNTYDYGGVVPRPQDVPALPTCHGPHTPFDSVFDMCGNVLEWVNWQKGQERGVVGGSYMGGEVSCSAAADYLQKWDVKTRTGGFRCCASMPE